MSRGPGRPQRPSLILSVAVAAIGVASLSGLTVVFIAPAVDAEQALDLAPPPFGRLRTHGIGFHCWPSESPGCSARGRVVAGPAHDYLHHKQTKQASIVPRLAAKQSQPHSIAPPSYVTQGKAFKTLIALVVICNVFASGMDAAGFISTSLSDTFDMVFTYCFLTELVCRLLEEKPRMYFNDYGNWFDFSLVVLSLVSLLFSLDSGSFGYLRGLRVARGGLRMVRVFRVLTTSSKFGKLGGVAFFVALSAELTALGCQSVVGMLTVFVSLLALQKFAGESRATSAYAAIEPGKAFLVKWGTLFFVPALVKLPLVEESFGGIVLLRLAVLLIAGFLGTLLSTMGIASLFPQIKAPAEPARVPAAGQANAAPPPYQKKLLLFYGLIMAASLAVFQLGLKPQLAEAVFMLFASLFGFVGGMLMPKNVQTFFHPMFVCIVVTWLAAGFWAWQDPSMSTALGVLATYSDWPGPGAVLSFMLGPVVTALGVLLFERRSLISRDLIPFLVTAFASAFTSLLGTAFLARCLSLPSKLAVASLLRCISSPFAADLVPIVGAESTIAIAMVVATGFTGVVLAPPIFKWLNIKSPRTRGLAMGASAHGLGTVALAGNDPEAFAYSAVSFLLVGTATCVLVQVPPFRALLLRIILG